MQSYKYNQFDSILIIAEGSNYEVGIIKKYEDISIVKSIHNNTTLYESYKIAYDFKVKNIFILNIKDISSYIDIAQVLMQYSFTYIVPVNIKFSDTFVNKLNNKRSNFLNEYLNTVSLYSDSIFIYTDEHASLYEDVDHFLLDQNKKMELALSYVDDKRNLNKHCCVLNNLKNYDYANVVLASALLATDVSEYPFYDFGEAIFDLDDFDVDENLIYFKNNIKVPTSIENLVNLRKERDVYKSLLTERLISYIKNNLDLNEFKAKLYTARVRLSVYEKVKDFFISINNKIIRGFNIKNISFKKIAPGEGILIIEVDILPINFVEKTSIVLEV